MINISKQTTEMETTLVSFAHIKATEADSMQSIFVGQI